VTINPGIILGLHPGQQCMIADQVYDDEAAAILRSIGYEPFPDPNYPTTYMLPSDIPLPQQRERHVLASQRLASARFPVTIMDDRTASECVDPVIEGSVIESRSPEVFTPATTPDTQGPDGGRTISATWKIGEPSDDNWQPQALLKVSHWSSTKSYKAVLSASRAQLTDPGPGALVLAVQQDMGMSARREVLAIAAAPRFDGRKLNAVFEAALAELRRRFQDGDQAVTVFFDPTFEEYTG